ncbi:GTP binding protein-like protein [Lindgomyces ingoldianus]|uniref:GTP binding protein-like protein n=1 Tax=Lindgomyces ingoldianus TaxID=673940 RepID=A0ACB6R4Z4_9PLEO|nr:GTP binding protein-like protein [Lindgomyces ingoldianus]KAF2473375.1 GTP binding protein-like protein [Lindgomyces ingoldianus]
MSQFSGNSKDFLDSLESCLDKHPRNQYESLKGVPDRLTGFLEQGDEGTCERAVQLLGTAVGKERDWQSPFQENGVLAHVVQKLDPASNSTGLAKQYLRVIGNCVADNDENREAVCENLGTLIACLKEEDLTVTALAVLLNLCNDFEPAQIEAAKLRLDCVIAELLAANRILEEAVDYATDLLTWTTEKLTPVQVEDATSVKTFDSLLQVSLQYEEDHYHDWVAICVHYLQDPEFQQKVAKPEVLEKLFDLMLDYESRLSPEEIQAVFRALGASQDPSKTPTEDTNTTLLVQLVNSLSAISASDAFVNHFSLRSPVVKKVRSKLFSLATSPSTVCACIMLGNLATSDQISIDMVEDMGLHLTLIGLLSARREPALLYAAAGFMRHLAFPEENRDAIGEAGLIETCCQLLLNKDPSVRGEAAAIVCKLVSNNFRNIEKVVYEAIPDDITPTQLPGVELPVHPTILYHIVTQALVPAAPLPSTSMKNAMIEIGRTIIAILRYLGQSNAEEDVEPVARHMFKTPLVARPVARLVRQRFFAEAQSEGLLGLGLMAQSHEGAVCVVDEMKEDEGLLNAVREFTAAEKKDDQQNGDMLGRDHQNALVLLHGLATNGVNAMDASLKDDVNALQTELSKLNI